MPLTHPSTPTNERFALRSMAREAYSPMPPRPARPMRPTMPANLDPSVTLAAVLWSIAVPAVQPSDVRHVYERIECVPSVGRNLSMKV